MGKTLTASSMITVPPTVGVIQPAEERQAGGETGAATSAATATRVASSGRPPATTAAAETLMKAPEVPM